MWEKRRFWTGAHMLGCMKLKEWQITYIHNMIVVLLFNLINMMWAEAKDLEVDRRSYKHIVQINKIWTISCEIEKIFTCFPLFTLF